MKNTNKVIEAMSLILEQKAAKAAEEAAKEEAVVEIEVPAVAVSLGLRFLRKKDGSMVLQEGVNDVYTDVPMVVE